MDCIAGMGMIPDKSVDCILTDPPYGKTACKWDEIIPLEPMWEEMKRIIKPRGAIILTSCEPFTSRLVMSNLEMFQYDLIWHKANGTGFLGANKKPLRNHENILIFSKGSTTYNPQKWKGKPYFRGETNGKSGCYSYYGKHVSKSEEGLRYPNSILFGISNAKKGGLHPTQKPVALFEYLIRTYTNPGELVLDNCMGSGTTAVACIRSDRDYIGFELDKGYCEAAQARAREEKCDLSEME